MGVKFANNAYGTLNAGITSSDTSLTLSSGQGARFPTLASGEYFYATLIDTSNNLEVVKVTARVTDVLTIVRGQESTTARAYSIGDRVELRITAAGLNDILGSATLDADPSPQLSANLDLNGNDITGTGNIDIAGSLSSNSTFIADSTRIRIPSSASAPSSPVAGDMYHNTGDSRTYIYNGTSWLPTDFSAFEATGGTVTSSGGYTYHTFTSSGTFTVTGDETKSVEYLIVAGGGGGGGHLNGYWEGAGGGAGGYLSGTRSTSSGIYSVIVGGGGAANSNGGNSSMFGLTAIGGGRGGHGTQSGGNGGSGGGAGYNAPSIGFGTSGQGNNGGAYHTSLNTGGSGGGAGAAGISADTPVGGAGKQWVNGSYYAGGGGGGRSGGTASGGIGGGGTGQNAGSAGSGTSGQANTGGGGGGGWSSTTSTGSPGGSGIVIVRY